MQRAAVPEPVHASPVSQVVPQQACPDLPQIVQR
jgi:hypothetical protein